MSAVSDPQIQILLGLVAQGQGVESALKSMGVDVGISLDALQKHPAAKGWIKDAKVQLATARAIQATQLTQ